VLTVLIAAAALVAMTASAHAAKRYQRRRAVARNPVAKAFSRREFRRLDAHLESVARDELRRLDTELSNYLAGHTGHVVVVTKARGGVALHLSDGRRLALRGISFRYVDMLTERAQLDQLRPESLERTAVSCQLLLRGPAGAALTVYARTIALAT
jgi:hypothetical protein